MLPFEVDTDNWRYPMKAAQLWASVLEGKCSIIKVGITSVYIYKLQGPCNSVHTRKLTEANCTIERPGFITLLNFVGR